MPLLPPLEAFIFEVVGVTIASELVPCLAVWIWTCILAGMFVLIGICFFGVARRKWA